MPRRNTVSKTDLTNTHWLLTGTFNTLTYPDIVLWLHKRKARIGWRVYESITHVAVGNNPGSKLTRARARLSNAVFLDEDDILRLMAEDNNS